MRSQSEETNREDVNAHPDAENQYVNTIALAAAREEQPSSTTSEKNQTNQTVELYQDLNIGAASAEPVVYETIKPRVKPKPRQGESKA